MRWLAILALSAIPLYGSNLRHSVPICLDDRVHVGKRVEAAFDQELRQLLSRPALRLVFGKCSETGIRISIRSHAPAQYPTALGLAFTAGGRVLPALELYTANILRRLQGHAGSELFGRALAKVAFHEIQHYLRQERDHDGAGLFSESLTAGQLLAAAEPFLPPGSRKQPD